MKSDLILLIWASFFPSLLHAQLFHFGILPKADPTPQAQEEQPQQQKKSLESEITEAQSELARIEESAGGQSPQTANAASALAELYLKAGDYERAGPLIERSLKIRRQNPGENDLEEAASLHQLAEFREELGEYSQAEILYEKARDIRKGAGPKSVQLAATLHAMGRLLSKMNHVEEAQKNLREALAIRKEQLPAGDVQIAYTLYELAKIEGRNGNSAQAKEDAEAAQEIFQTELGADHSDTQDARSVMEVFGETLNGKIISYADRIKHLGETPEPGKPPDQQHWRELFLSGRFNEEQAQTLSDYAQGRLESGNAEEREQALLMQERALRIRQRVLGPEHPRTLQSLQRFALAALVQGQYEKALVAARKAMFAQTRHLQRIFSFTDEQQRLDFQATVKPFSLFASLPEVPASDLATAMLRFKGAVLDSLLTERRQADASQDPALRPLLVRSVAAKEAWRQLEMDAIAADSSALTAIDQRRTVLDTEFQEIERSFEQAGLGTGDLPASVTASQVASALRQDEVLVELIRYPHYLDATQTEDRYGAILLAAATAPIWVALGAASETDQLVTSYQHSVSSTRSGPSEPDEYALEAALRKLYDRIWLPIERALPRTYNRVLISPDGALDFVSFATLVAPDRHFLAEKVSISYVASGRDLIVGQPRSAKKLVVCAAPYFEAAMPIREDRSATPAHIRGIQADTYGEPTLEPLPGTGREVESLAALASQWGWEVMILEGSNALEGRLREIHSPGVLHLATHAFFLPEDAFPKAKEQLKNPMRRAGLALYGAQSTFELWEEGKVPGAGDDGILSAEDVSTLNLRGTWIVALPACLTGWGEPRAGEGVLGLRRGFIQAGTENLLMTLWPITDAEFTAQFMSDFYEAAHKGGNAAQALADVQRDWLVKKTKVYPRARAVYLAGAFIISSQGRP
jgi:CHAT domain-containing protein/tetratricopeptide (TPR) repeat protein